MFGFRIFSKIRFKVRVRVSSVFRINVRFMVNGRARFRVLVGFRLGLQLG